MHGAPGKIEPLLDGSSGLGVRGVALALVPFLVLAGLLWSVPPSVSAGDWAHYLLHAKALAEGRPYGDIGYIYNPITPFVGPRLQPPGLPLTLVPIVAVGGVHSPLIKVLAVAFAVAFLWLALRVLSRLGLKWHAVGAVLMTGIALESSYATAAIGSDLGFCALIWVVIGAIDADGPLDRRRLLTATLAGGLAMAYRLAALALIPALILYAIVNWQQTKARPLVPVVLWTGTALLTVLAFIGLPDWIRLADLAKQIDFGSVRQSIDQYKLGFFGSVLYPFRSNLANDAYHLIAALFGVVGIARVALAWRRRFIAAFVLCYAVMLLSVRVHEPRYIWVLYPLLAYAALYGLTTILGRLRPFMHAATAPRIAVAVALVVSLATSVLVLRTPARPGLIGQPDAEALFALLRRQPPGTRVAFSNPRVLTLETGIPAMALFRQTDSVVLKELRGRAITHVITDTLRLQPGSMAYFVGLTSRLPELFRPMYRNGTFTLYRLDWLSHDATQNLREPGNQTTATAR